MADNRYGTDPARLGNQKDVVEYLKDVFSRLAAGETAQRIGNTAIDSGNLTLRDGNIIVVDPDDNVIMRIKGDNAIAPEIKFHPLGDNDTHQAAIFSVDFNNDPSNPDQLLAIIIETVDNSGTDGGKLLLGRNFAVLSHHPSASGGEESYLWLNAFGSSTPEVALFRGKWSNQIQSDSHQGIYPGSFAASSGFTTWTHTYFSPFATSMIPIVSVANASAVSTAISIDSQSTSAFTVRFSTTTGNKTVNFWNFRV